MKKTLLINNTLYYFTLLTFGCLAFGFLWQRVFYSIGLLLMGVQFLVAAYSYKDIFQSRYFLLALSIPFCNLLRDGFNNIFFINLSIPLFVAFFLANKYKEEWLKNGFLTSSIVFLLTAFYTTYLYFSDIETTIGLYKIAQVVGVGAFNDHIRFSIVTSLSMIVLWYLYRSGQFSKIEKYYANFYFLFMSIFLHLLAARTGLMIMYVMIFLLILFNVFETRQYWRLAFLLLLPVLPIVSYYVFPSFFHRVGYSFYDFNTYRDFIYREGSSDGIRFYSILSGLDIFKDNSVIGVGFQDLKSVSNDWYRTHFPSMKEDEMMLPHNQYIVYAASAGLLGLIAVIVLLFYPLTSWKSISAEGKVIVLGFIFICLIEVFFDSQIKIYAYGLFIPFAYLYMPEKKVNNVKKSLN